MDTRPPLAKSGRIHYYSLSFGIEFDKLTDMSSNEGSPTDLFAFHKSH